DQRHRHGDVPDSPCPGRSRPADQQPARQGGGCMRAMRILVVGSGGVGDAFARIAVQRDFFELLVMSDYDEARASATVAAARARRPGEARLVAAKVDASSSGAVAAMAREHGVTHILNAVDP